MLLAFLAIINLLCAAVLWGRFLAAPSISGLLLAIFHTTCFFYSTWLATDGR